MRRKTTTAAMAALITALTLMAHAAAPALTIGAATAISTKTATFNGNLTAGGTAVITAYWGTSASDLWCSANLGLLAEGAVTYIEYSLLSARTYYYRFHAVNNDGEAWSDIRSFTTTSITANPRFGGGRYDGYASASILADIPPSSTMIVIR